MGFFFLGIWTLCLKETISLYMHLFVLFLVNYGIGYVGAAMLKEQTSYEPHICLSRLKKQTVRVKAI